MSEENPISVCESFGGRRDCLDVGVRSFEVYVFVFETFGFAVFIELYRRVSF
jgi:hypothetical protein